jgi:integrase
VLPKAALAIVQAQPHLGSNPYVFAGLGGGPFRCWSFAKSALDAKLPSDMAQWQLHDLRRTARSLMSRAGVSSEHAERVMGGVYDHYKYAAEKAAALKRLATLIDAIVHERTASVLLLNRKRN